MFKKSEKGVYMDKGDKVTYTFSQKAGFAIQGVEIPLEEIQVECWGDGFDSVTIEHFTAVSALILPQKKGLYNSTLFINDYIISEKGYPSKEYFLKNNRSYINPVEYNQLRSQTTSFNPDVMSLSNFIRQGIIGERKLILQKIINILKTDNN